MKTKINKLVLVLALGAVMGGCAAPSPPEPVGPRVPVNTEKGIAEYRAAEAERLRVRFAAEAEAREREENDMRRAAHLQYLQEKQRYMESLPRGLEPVPRITPKRAVRKARPAPVAAPAPAAAEVEQPNTPPAEKPAVVVETPKKEAEKKAVETRGAPPPVGPTFVPRRSAS